MLFVDHLIHSQILNYYTIMVRARYPAEQTNKQLFLKRFLACGLIKPFIEMAGVTPNVS